MHLEVTCSWKEFNELSLDDLYAILNLRQKVFVLEQDCPYIDADYSDQDAFHLLGYKDNDLIAYLRAFKPGIKYEGSSLGRIVTEINSRGLGVGKMITIEGVNFLRKELVSGSKIASIYRNIFLIFLKVSFWSSSESIITVKEPPSKL